MAHTDAACTHTYRCIYRCTYRCTYRGTYRYIYRYCLYTYTQIPHRWGHPGPRVASLTWPCARSWVARDSRAPCAPAPVCERERARARARERERERGTHKTRTNARTNMHAERINIYIAYTYETHTHTHTQPQTRLEQAHLQGFRAALDRGRRHAVATHPRLPLSPLPPLLPGPQPHPLQIRVRALPPSPRTLQGRLGEGGGGGSGRWVEGEIAERDHEDTVVHFPDEVWREVR